MSPTTMKRVKRFSNLKAITSESLFMRYSTRFETKKLPCAMHLQRKTDSGVKPPTKLKLRSAVDIQVLLLLLQLLSLPRIAQKVQNCLQSDFGSLTDIIGASVVNVQKKKTKNTRPKTQRFTHGSS